MSPFDRSARLKTDQPVSEKEYLEFVQKNVLAWTDVDKQKVKQAIEAVKPKLAKLALPLPNTIYLIVTTGEEEGGAAYTRGDAIVFSRRQLSGSAKSLEGLVCHELFHVLSRANPELRERLYGIIGFTKCDELELPEPLKARKITNPDAPKNDHCIQLKIDGKPAWAVPVLIARTENYDIARGGEFFDYMQFKFALVERGADTQQVKLLRQGNEPALIDGRGAAGYSEQIGRNTGYIIHPEEILAENFRLLAQGTETVASPEILAKMREILTAHNETKP